MKITQNYIAHLLLAVLIFILPVYMRITNIPGVNLQRVSKDELFVAVSCVLLVLFNSVNRISIFSWVALGAIPALILNVHNAASSTVQNQIVYIVAGLCLFIKLSVSLKDKYQHLILNGVCLAIVVQVIFGMLEYAGFNAMGNFYSLFFGNLKLIEVARQSDMVYGTLGNPNIFAALLSIGAMAFIRGSWMFIMPLMIFPAMYLSHSMMGWATLLVGMIALFFMEMIQFHLKKIMTLVAVSYIIFASINPFNIANGRMGIMTSIYGLLTPFQKIFGAGAGWLYDARVYIAETRYIQSHSEYFDGFIILGIPGLVALVCLIYKGLKHAGNRHYFAMACAAAFNALGNFNLHTSPTAVLFITALAGCYATRKSNGFD